MEPSNFNTLVFLDIDGTLLGIDQKPTIPDLGATISKLQSKGVRFGLNSNRAYEDVLGIVGMFNLDGPFILENGALFVDGPGGKIVVSEGVIQDIPKIAFEVTKQALENMGIESTPVFSDTVELNEKDFGKNGTYVFLNKNRKYSASIHHRIDGKSSFDFAQKLAKQMQKSFDDEGCKLIALSHNHGHTITIEIPNINKATGLAFFKTKYSNIRLVAIGDDMSEVILRPQIDLLFAVANADLELKQVADHTSLFEATAGVKDILENHLQKK